MSTNAKSEGSRVRRRSASNNSRLLIKHQAAPVIGPLAAQKLKQAMSSLVDVPNDDTLAVHLESSQDPAPPNLEHTHIEIVEADLMSENAVKALLNLLGRAIDQIVKS